MLSKGDEFREGWLAQEEGREGVEGVRMLARAGDGVVRRDDEMGQGLELFRCGAMTGRWTRVSVRHPRDKKPSQEGTYSMTPSHCPPFSTRTLQVAMDRGPFRRPDSSSRSLAQPLHSSESDLDFESR